MIALYFQNDIVDYIEYMFVSCNLNLVFVEYMVIKLILHFVSRPLDILNL